MAWIAVIGTVVSAGVSAYGASQNRIAANKANDAINKNRLNVGQVIDDARKQAEDNYANAIALENKYDPTTAALRLQSNQSLTDVLNGNTAGLQARNKLLGELGDANPLLKASTENILKQLSLGGKLDAETQAAVTKGALEAGGSAGISGSGAGRGLVARDLGLTSLNLINQRNAAALQGGNALSADFASRFGLAGTAAAQDQGAALTIANLMNSRALPNAGLDPGAVANLDVGVNNQQNQNIANRAQIQIASNNANAAAISQLIGGLSGAYGSYAGSAAGILKGGGTVTGSGGAPASDPSVSAANSSLVNGWFVGCWVAREVYGAHNLRWRMFRSWMFEDAPKWLLSAYLKYGEEAAQSISNCLVVKERIRTWMDSKIDEKFSPAQQLAFA